MTRREMYPEIFAHHDRANFGLTKKELIAAEIELFGYNSFILRKELIAAGEIRVNGEKYYYTGHI